MEIAVILAAGKGLRAGSPTPKQFCTTFLGTRIVDITIGKFAQLGIKTVVVHNSNNSFEVDSIAGGKTRQESCYKALQYISKYHPSKVIIHDAVRPFVSCNLITSIIQNTPCVPYTVPSNATVDTSFNYSDAYLVQTPQAFNFKPLIAAHASAAKANQQFKDDGSLFATMNNTKIKFIPGESSNIKITTSLELDYAIQIFNRSGL